MKNTPRKSRLMLAFTAAAVIGSSTQISGCAAITAQAVLVNVASTAATNYAIDKYRKEHPNADPLKITQPPAEVVDKSSPADAETIKRLSPAQPSSNARNP